VGRRQQARLQRDEITRLEIGLAAHREPHARRRRIARQPFGAGDAQHETRAGAAQIHLLYEAGQKPDSDARQDRRVDPRRAPAGREKAAADAGEKQQRREKARGFAGAKGAEGEREARARGRRKNTAAPRRRRRAASTKRAAAARPPSRPPPRRPRET
jgi:hypothetical protein